jgi:hypothetical protein
MLDERHGLIPIVPSWKEFDHRIHHYTVRRAHVRAKRWETNFNIHTSIMGDLNLCQDFQPANAASLLESPYKGLADWLKELLVYSNDDKEILARFDLYHWRWIDRT